MVSSGHLSDRGWTRGFDRTAERASNRLGSGASWHRRHQRRAAC